MRKLLHQTHDPLARTLNPVVTEPGMDAWAAVDMTVLLKDLLTHQGGAEEDRLWTRLNDATIPGYQGACYLQLQQPHTALVALQDTLTSVPAYSPRHRSLILADMAAAMQQMEEVEEACTFLRSALEITAQTKSLMVLMRMQRVRNN